MSKKIKIENTHVGIQCDGCGKNPIEGIRYKCNVCDDFDYCENCEDENGESHGHAFIKMRKPEHERPLIKVDNVPPKQPRRQPPNKVREFGGPFAL